MIVIELRLLNFSLIVFFLAKFNNLVEAGAGRCYLCSENTLAQCGGSAVGSPIHEQVLQYYTEPCNGQCVLFRSMNNSVVRGCSWTYGHMNAKETGWHDLSSGIRAYFCDTFLCNNGTIEQSDLPIRTKEVYADEPNSSPVQTLTPEFLTIIEENTPSIVPTGKVFILYFQS